MQSINSVILIKEATHTHTHVQQSVSGIVTICRFFDLYVYKYAYVHIYVHICDIWIMAKKSQGFKINRGRLKRRRARGRYIAGARSRGQIGPG